MGEVILKTGRLYLEKLTTFHFEDLCALLSNPKVHRYFPGVLDRRESAEFFHKIQQKYLDDGCSFWALCRRSDDQFLGICGVLKQVIEGKEEAEIAYRLLDRYWGRGYATEAAAGCIEYARDELGKLSVISLIREVNLPSIRVAQKNGLEFEKVVAFAGLEHRLYRRQFFPQG